IYTIYGVISFSATNDAVNGGTFSMSIAGGVNFNLENSLEAEVQATLTLSINSNGMTITLSGGEFIVPQIQAAPLGSAAGQINILQDGNSVGVWGGLLLTPDVGSLPLPGI